MNNKVVSDLFHCPKFFTIAFAFIILPFYISAQQNSGYTIAIEKLASDNIKTIMKQVKGNEQQVKILVLPFYNKNGKFDRKSEDFAKEIANAFQRKIDLSDNVVFYDSKTFFNKESNKVLDGFKDINNYRKAGMTETQYIDSLKNIIKPEFVIEGKYIIADEAGRKKLILSNIKCRNNIDGIDQSKLQIIALKSSEAYLSMDDIKSEVTDGNIWASGSGSTFEKAGKKAMENLLAKISLEMESKFLNLLTVDEDDIKKMSEVIIGTYANAAMQKAQTKIVIEEPGRTEVVRYMKPEDLTGIFDQRKRKIVDFINSAKSAEKNYETGDALRYYYWALSLLRTHPDYDKIKHNIDGNELTLITALPDKIRSLLNSISFSVNEINYNHEEDSKTIVFNLTFNDSKVRNLEYKYYTGNTYSPLTAANNGLAYVELYGEACRLLDKIKVVTEYEFINKSKIDYEVNTVLSNMSMPYFPEAVKTIALADNRSKEQEVQSEAKDTRENVADKLEIKAINKVDSVEFYKQTIDAVVKAIEARKYTGLESYFTKEGLEIFNKLIKYGRAKILTFNQELNIVRIEDEIIVRSIPMSFNFSSRSGGKNFIEDVVFTFTPEKKIDNVSFALGEKAVNDIEKKSQWPDEAKIRLIQFMENYKTAYALERTEYIESIFADNALIIVGKILKKAENIDGMYSSLKNQDVEYIKLTKKVYIERLRSAFANNEFVNIQFEDNIVEKRDNKSEVYGIQIKQNYYSTNYADQGYLFLMIDMANKEAPKIYVRSWQPEKNPDGSIIGLKDFRY